MKLLNAFSSCCIWVALTLSVVGAQSPPDQDIFGSGAKGDITQQMNSMWATFGRGENVRLTPFGNEPGWYEWMARKHVWSDTPKYREQLRSFMVDWPQSKDGYMWTWGTEEGWPTHHVRHNENNGKYILAVWRHFCWQGGQAFLETTDPSTRKSTQKGQSDVSKGKTVLQKVRDAMDYQLKTLEGGSGLAIIRDPQCDGTVKGMPSDYWDNFLFGYKSAYLNIYFYASLFAMADIEESQGETQKAGELRYLAAEVKRQYNETFWDEKKGRYIGCIDVTGRRWDFGFTYLNLEAIEYGLASETQAKRIYDWLDGRRIVASDKQKVGQRMTGATGEEIYDLVWAPRATTRAVESIKVDGRYWWWDLHNKITVDRNASYGEHLENGGAIFYVSHYDLMSRLKTFGPDNAWKRFEAILGEFRKDRLLRDPRNNVGAAWKWGIIGEFPESGLVPATVALGFMGLHATAQDLVVEPRLPKALPWLEVKHVAYRGGLYRVRADKSSIQVTTLNPSPIKATVRSANSTSQVLAAKGGTVTIPL